MRRPTAKPVFASKRRAYASSRQNAAVQDRAVQWWLSLLSQSLTWLMTVQISQPLAPLVDEFAQRLFRELDYEAEGRNAEQFQHLYADVPRVRLH